MKTETRKSMAQSAPFIAVLITLVILISLSEGCGNRSDFTSDSTVSSDSQAITPTPTLPVPSPSESPITFFRAYVYAPSSTQAQMRDTMNWPSVTGIAVLLSNTAPSGYTAVSGAHVFPENNPSRITTTDSAGIFTINFMSESGLSSDGGLPLIIRPMDNFARFAAVRMTAYPMTTAVSMSSICIHPDPAELAAGGVRQLYVKGTMGNGLARILDPSVVTWQSDLTEVISITQQGVVSGIKAGSAAVPANVGSLNCTGKLTVLYGSSASCTLTGVITDRIGNTVTGAVISVQGNDNAAISGSFGHYCLPGLKAGADLQIAVSIQGAVRYRSTITAGPGSMLNISIPDLTAASHDGAGIQSGSMAGETFKAGESLADEVKNKYPYEEE